MKPLTRLIVFALGALVGRALALAILAYLLGEHPGLVRQGRV